MNFTDINIPLICFISFILIVWFETDIILTIANITNTRSLLKIDEFHKYRIEIDVMSNYPNFLYNESPGYITKLLSCPICLCFWLTVISSNLLVYFTQHPQIFVLLILPVNYILSLLTYLVIRKLL